MLRGIRISIRRPRHVKLPRIFEIQIECAKVMWKKKERQGEEKRGQGAKASNSSQYPEKLGGVQAIEADRDCSERLMRRATDQA